MSSCSVSFTTVENFEIQLRAAMLGGHVALTEELIAVFDDLYGTHPLFASFRKRVVERAQAHRHERDRENAGNPYSQDELASTEMESTVFFMDWETVAEQLVHPHPAPVTFVDEERARATPRWQEERASEARRRERMQRYRALAAAAREATTDALSKSPHLQNDPQ